MRPLHSKTPATLAAIGSIMASAAFAGPANASHTGSCQPQHMDKSQLIAAVLNQPWFVGKPPPMYIGGCRVRVDPHGQYVPTEYGYNPATGRYEPQ